MSPLVVKEGIYIIFGVMTYVKKNNMQIKNICLGERGDNTDGLYGRAHFMNNSKMMFVQ